MNIIIKQAFGPKSEFGQVSRRRINQNQVQVAVRRDARARKYETVRDKTDGHRVCHIYEVSAKPRTVAKRQQKAAEILWRADDSEFHSLRDLPHTCSSTIDLQASMHLKNLTTRYYKLGSNASSQLNTI